VRVKVGEQEGEGTLRILTLIEAALSPILSFSYPRGLHDVFLSGTAEDNIRRGGGGQISLQKTGKEPIETARPGSQTRPRMLYTRSCMHVLALIAAKAAPSAARPRAQS